MKAESGEAWGVAGLVLLLGSQYLDLLDRVKQDLGTEWPLAITIPVWWDKRAIARQGRVLPLSR